MLKSIKTQSTSMVLSFIFLLGSTPSLVFAWQQTQLWSDSPGSYSQVSRSGNTSPDGTFSSASQSSINAYGCPGCHGFMLGQKAAHQRGVPDGNNGWKYLVGARTDITQGRMPLNQMTSQDGSASFIPNSVVTSQGQQMSRSAQQMNRSRRMVPGEYFKQNEMQRQNQIRNKAPGDNGESGQMHRNGQIRNQQVPPGDNGKGEEMSRSAQQVNRTNRQWRQRPPDSEIPVLRTPVNPGQDYPVNSPRTPNGGPGIDFPTQQPEIPSSGNLPGFPTTLQPQDVSPGEKPLGE